MTLEEGIRILKNEKNETFSPYQVLEARDTLINYIENESIAKDDVKEKIMDLKEHKIALLQHGTINEDYHKCLVFAERTLKELLGE